jgi:phospholipase C
MEVVSMHSRLSNWREYLPSVKQVLALFVAVQLFVATPLRAQTDGNSNDEKTTSPIKHVIIIIGENRSFDHVFATYVPKKGQNVSNLLSKGIVKADGTPGPNYSKSAQFSAVDPSGAFTIAPATKTAYTNIPTPLTDGAPEFASDTTPATAPFITLSVAVAAEPDLFPTYNFDLLTGATGLPSKAPDTRIDNVFKLNGGAFQLTPGVRYDDYAGSPVHRFYQMWQQMDCNASLATKTNSSGCQADLFPWVETTIGAGSNGNPQPAGFDAATTGEGSTSMAFYNVQNGDAPYFKHLADSYSLSDNFHQSVMGGTGANHIMFGFGDAIWFTDGKGNAAVPPTNEIENPNPQTGTNNYYDQDGYGGGTYSDCADLSQPGVPAVVNYLQALPRPVNPNCEAGHYYLLNNYNPGFLGNGVVLPLALSPFTIPPVPVRHIGDVLMEHNVSFKYYGEQWDRYVADSIAAEANPAATPNPFDDYCNICNPFQYATDIMTSAKLRTEHIQDTDKLNSDIKNNTLPAVSIVKPSGYTDGHPASSKLDLFEGFVKKIVTDVQANPSVWKDTAIFITFDEGGGYYDSGYVQPVDFFGDGTRIPLLAVSPYSHQGNVGHVYYDHVSLLKFIERNWSLPPVTKRSRDNLPEPKTASGNPYVPVNSPALGDLFGLFDFERPDFSPE